MGIEMSDVKLTLAQQTTYMYLGLIAAHAGHGEAVYRTIKDLEDGKRSTDPLDIGAWFASGVNESEDLGELYTFRNRLFHGVCLVNRGDGSVKIFREAGRDTETEYTYSQEELRRLAVRFLFTAFGEHSVEMTVSSVNVEGMLEGGMSDEESRCMWVHHPESSRNEENCPKKRWVFRQSLETETATWVARLADDARPCLHCWEQ